MKDEGLVNSFLPYNLSFFICHWSFARSLVKGPSGNKVCILARAPGGQMRGAATEAMPVCIVEERQQSRCPPAAAPLRAAARRPAGGVARSLHTAPGMLVARALPAGLGASSKMYTLFPDGPLAGSERKRTPGICNKTYAPRQRARGELLQPLPG